MWPGYWPLHPFVCKYRFPVNNRRWMVARVERERHRERLQREIARFTRVMERERERRGEEVEIKETELEIKMSDDKM